MAIMPLESKGECHKPWSTVMLCQQAKCCLSMVNSM